MLESLRKAIPSMSDIPPDEFERRLATVEAAIDKHGNHLQGFLITLTKNTHDAEELFDDLWVHVLHRFKIEDISKMGYLRRKAYQLFVDFWRKKQRNPVTTVEILPEEPASSAFHDAATPEEEEALKRNFFAEYDAGLSDDQRDALWLHARYGYTFTEIGKLMQKPSSTVGDWIAQARKSFAEAFNSTTTLQKR